MSSQIKIESGVPLPERPRPTHSKYPWAEMEIGDSFAIPTCISAHSFRSAATQQQKRSGRKFSVRVHNGSHRCWRVK